MFLGKIFFLTVLSSAASTKTLLSPVAVVASSILLLLSQSLLDWGIVGAEEELVEAVLDTAVATVGGPVVPTGTTGTTGTTPAVVD